MKIENDVLDILARSNVSENILFLPPVQLERNLYTKVNKCLEIIGGKWNRKVKGHIFDNNPSDLLDEMINTGEVTDKKKEFQFFATPKNVVYKMIELAEIKNTDVLLEPEAGQGNILEEFPKNNPYIAIELMNENCDVLRKKGFSVHQGDFLESSILDVDVVIMNPPFSNQQDIDHVFRAWECLSPGGRLVSIVSVSPFFRETKKAQLFREFLKDNNAKIIDLEPGTFKENGTMVRTKIISLVKQ